MKNLNNILEDICVELGLPFGREEAINANAKKYLELEYSSTYGGYRLVNVNVEGGGHSSAFGESSVCPRKPLKEMTAYLEGILAGIKA